MSEKMHKNILFYSNRDTYSKKVLNIISSKKRDNEFVFICVDDKNIQLPSFLKVVPTIFLVREQDILVDESIEEYFSPKQKNVSGGENKTNELDAYFDSNNGFSSSYSNIDDSVSNSNNSMFSYINDDLTGGVTDTGLETPRGNLSNEYEKLAEARKNDFTGIQRV